MHPPLYQNHDSSAKQYTEQPAWYQSFNAECAFPESGGNGSSLPHNMRDRNIAPFGPASFSGALSTPSHKGPPQYQSYGRSHPVLSVPTVQEQDLPASPFPVSYLGINNGSIPSLATSNVNSWMAPDLQCQDVFNSGVIPKDANDPVFDMFRPDGDALFDNLTSPNTFLAPATPSWTGRSPWTVGHNALGISGTPELSSADFLSPTLSCDFDLFELGTDCIAPEQISINTASSSYPPPPDGAALTLGPPELSMNPHVPTSNPYLRTRPLMQESQTYVDLERCRSLGLWDTEAQGRAVRSSSTTSTGKRPLLARNAIRDTSKDEYLVRCKEQGMSYKQIKESGGFDEAESTLRGRYRALTKPREARLRKPEWGPREVDLLLEGVAHCSKSTTGNPLLEFNSDVVAIGRFANKVPWKQVAEYMESKGTYRYGNATVKKKYLEIIKGQSVSA
ncbi:hypothetical protein ABEF95_015998 [Exophiala dermatitidis]